MGGAWPRKEGCRGGVVGGGYWVVQFPNFSGGLNNSRKTLLFGRILLMMVLWEIIRAALKTVKKILVDYLLYISLFNFYLIPSHHLHFLVKYYRVNYRVS